MNDQPDKAIDAFIEVVKLDPETIELHQALGNLFRRRGEFDRAVRIHTHLLNRADLPARQRSQALDELGQDYLKAGLLDRAEDAFVQLLEDRHHRFDALRALVRIYQTEREWLKAVDCARQLEREAGESRYVPFRITTASWRATHWHATPWTKRSMLLMKRWRLTANRFAR